MGGCFCEGAKYRLVKGSQLYNARQRQRGPLFQGRYRAIPVATDAPEYFPVVSTYIGHCVSICIAPPREGTRPTSHGAGEVRLLLQRSIWTNLVADRIIRLTEEGTAPGKNN